MTHICRVCSVILYLLNLGGTTLWLSQDAGCCAVNAVFVKQWAVKAAWILTSLSGQTVAPLNPVAKKRGRSIAENVTTLFALYYILLLMIWNRVIMVWELSNVKSGVKNNARLRALKRSLTITTCRSWCSMAFDIPVSYISWSGNDWFWNYWQKTYKVDYREQGMHLSIF